VSPLAFTSTFFTLECTHTVQSTVNNQTTLQRVYKGHELS